MVRIAICDDNAQELEQTCACVKAYETAKIGWNFAVDKFSDGYALLESIDKTGGYDIYILDIVLPRLNGIQIGAEINKRNAGAQIILLSTSPEFGVDSYTIFAKDYILKPCSQEKLFASLDRTLGNLQVQKPKYYILKTADGVYAAPYHMILYVEYYKHQLICHLTNGELVKTLNLRESFAVLTDTLVKEGNFLRISASHVINMQYVKKFTSRVFELINNESLPLSRLYADARGLYMDYIFDKKAPKNGEE